jgi:hypothetical protein
MGMVRQEQCYVPFHLLSILGHAITSWKSVLLNLEYAVPEICDRSLI